ncbi:MAG TPA: hypothetical protein VHI98_14090 [Vicinamibacterales bacterium]|jgi:hypothetical protein|nr:hypothetical protein [Vicinamibacterales bacterium]
MIAGLARQIAGSDAVLRDQHAIAVESADDRPGRPRAERPLGDTRLALEGVRERPASVLGQLDGIEARDRVERLERRRLARRIRGHSQLFVNAEREAEVNRRGLLGSHRDLLPFGGQVLALREHGVGARRDIGDFVLPGLVGDGCAPQLRDEHGGAVDRVIVLRKRDRTADTARAGQRCRLRCHQHRRREQNNE